MGAHAASNVPNDGAGYHLSKVYCIVFWEWGKHSKVSQIQCGVITNTAARGNTNTIGRSQRETRWCPFCQLYPVQRWPPYVHHLISFSNQRLRISDQISSLQVDCWVKNTSQMRYFEEPWMALLERCSFTYMCKNMHPHLSAMILCQSLFKKDI